MMDKRGKTLRGLLAVAVMAVPSFHQPTHCDDSFVRGDANRDGALEIADAVRIFGFLFLGGVDPTCPDAADANDTGEVDITDGIFILNFLFLGGAAPPAPFPKAGPDSTDDGLRCNAGPLCTEWVNTLGMRFIHLPPGSFHMGSPEGERARWSKEGPVHPVEFTRGFYLGATEVTQGQYEQVTGANPSFYQGHEYGTDLDRPVERVNWADAMEFCRLLSEIEGRTYRLPTEAEWEYACRAGTTTRYFFGDGLECDDECETCPLAQSHLWWCGNNGLRGTKPVGQKAANPWCFHDMHGSVWEWCLDWAGPYGSEPEVDPTGPADGEEKVIRGGHYGLPLHYCRSAMRGDLSTEHRLEFLGFRVLLVEDLPAD